MQQNAVPGVLARRARAWLSAPAALAMMALPASAGDRAGIDFIGYSANGDFFAFEEFGIQDGSGFAYSSIYVVDLRKDDWVSGTPVRVRAESEAPSLPDIRTEAAEKAAATLDELSISTPVQIASLIGDGVPDLPAKRLVFGVPSFTAGEINTEHELVLSQFPAEAASPCAEWFTAEPLGYALSLEADGESRELHRDTTLPGSRGCPLDYRIYGVVLPFEAATIEDGVAILSVYPGGFEGPDRRFIAVPLAP